MPSISSAARGQVDVAVLRVGEVRGEGAHLLGDPERLGVGGRERRLGGGLALQRRGGAPPPGVRRRRRSRSSISRRVDLDADLGRHHPRLAPAHHEPGVLGLPADRAHHRLPAPRASARRRPAAPACRPPPPWRDPRRTAAAGRPPSGRRARASRVPTSPACRSRRAPGCTSSSPTSGCFTSVGSFCEPAVEEPSLEQVLGGGAGDHRPGLPSTATARPSLKDDRALARAAARCRASSVVEGRLQPGLVDVDLGVVVAASGDHVPHPRQAEAASHRRPPDRGRVVDAQPRLDRVDAHACGRRRS